VSDVIDGRVCTENPDLWTSDSLIDQLTAADKCYDCPLMQACAKAGVNEPYGVWGGLTEWDRPDAQKAETKRLKAAEDTERRELADKVLAVVEGGGSVAEAAVRYGLSRATAYRHYNAALGRATRARRAA
jgi:hypothetical protein